MKDSGHVRSAALFPFNIEWTLEEQITTEAVFTFNLHALRTVAIDHFS